MTLAQRFLYWLGAGRFRLFRRYVGGRWTQGPWCDSESPTWRPRMRWKHETPNANWHAIEQWTPPQLPAARVNKS